MKWDDNIRRKYGIKIEKWMEPSHNPVQFQQQVFGIGEYKFGTL
jgi:hypothetical protein